MPVYHPSHSVKKSVEVILPDIYYNLFLALFCVSNNYFITMKMPVISLYSSRLFLKFCYFEKYYNKQYYSYVVFILYMTYSEIVLKKYVSMALRKCQITRGQGDEEADLHSMNMNTILWKNLYRKIIKMGL